MNPIRIVLPSSNSGYVISVASADVQPPYVEGAPTAAPVVGSSPSVTITAGDTNVMTVLASDADTPVGNLTYSLAGADSSLFSISGSGVITFPGGAVEGVYSNLQVAVSDGENTTTQDLTITVQAANTYVPFTYASASTTNHDENSVSVGHSLASGGSDPVTYSIASGPDAALFAINTAGDAPEFIVAPDFENPTDANADNQYEFVTQATDGTTTLFQSHTVVIQDVDESFVFNNVKATEADRPVMSSPLNITTFAQLQTHQLTGAAEGINPGGDAYYIVPPTDTTDVLIDFTNETAVVDKPIILWHGRNFAMIGVRQKLEHQAAGNPGLLPNYNGDGMNRYQRIVTGRCVGVTCSGTSWIEGCHFDANGHNCDVMVENPYGTTHATTRKHYVLNCRAEGWRGRDDIPGTGPDSGEGSHADLWQYQNPSNKNHTMVFENIQGLSGQEGIIANMVPPDQAALTSVRNYAFAIDTNYIDADAKFHEWLLALSTNSVTVEVENIHFHRSQGADNITDPNNPGTYVSPYGIYYGDKYHTAPGLGNTITVLDNAELTLIGGTVAGGDLEAPTVDFAPAAHVGSNYSKPEALAWLAAQ